MDSVAVGDDAQIMSKHCFTAVAQGESDGCE